MLAEAPFLGCAFLQLSDLDTVRKKKWMARFSHSNDSVVSLMSNNCRSSARSYDKHITIQIFLQRRISLNAEKKKHRLWNKRLLQRTSLPIEAMQLDDLYLTY